MKNNHMLSGCRNAVMLALVFCFVFSCIGLKAPAAYAAAPSITLTKTSVTEGDEIVVRYNNTDSNDWVGIYPRGIVPGPIPSLRWCYVGNGSGSISLIRQSEIDANKPLEAGSYDVYLLDDGGYTVLDKKEITIYPPNIDSYRIKSIQIGSGRTITVTSSGGNSSSVGYELYLGNASGKLSGYTSLGTAVMKNGKYTYTVGSRVVIPDAATHIYAYPVINGLEIDQSASVKITNSSFYNRASMGKKLYDFQIFTDIHISYDIPIHNEHFRLALRDVLRLSPNSKGIITIGDNTNNGYESQWKLFNQIKDEEFRNKSLNMYFTMGNHDRDMNGNYGYANQVALFKQYTGAPAAYYSFKIENNSFFILGSERKGGFAYLSNTQLNWLKSSLEKLPEDEPVFVFIHEPLRDTVSGSLSYLNPVIQDWYGVEQNNQLRAIVDQYPNLMFFTGHTHWHFNTTQPMLYGEGKKANYFNAASVGYLWNDEDQEVVGSQGYYVEVYENGIFVKGRDFANSRWAPAAQFYVPLAKTSSTPTPPSPNTPTPPHTSGVTGNVPTGTPTPSQSTATPDLSGTATPDVTADSTAAATTPTEGATTEGSATPGQTGTASSAASASPTGTPSGSTAQPKKNNTALIIVAALLAAAAITGIVIAVVFYLKSKKGSSADV